MATHAKNNDDRTAVQAAEKAASLASQYVGVVHQTRLRLLQRRIDAVPTEIMLEIFKQLGSTALSSCSKVCQRWRNLIQGNPNLWLQQVLLKGSICEIMNQWSWIRKRQTGIFFVISLQTMLREDHFRDPDHSSTAADYDYNEYHAEISNYWIKEFLDVFPFKTLKHLKHCSDSSSADLALWKAIEKCEKLESLHFSSTSMRDDVKEFVSLTRIEPISTRMPIASCHIRDLQLAIPYIDWKGGNNIGLNVQQAQRLNLKMNLSSSVVERMLIAAAGTLEGLQICGCHQGVIGTGNDARLNTISLPLLRTFSLIPSIFDEPSHGDDLERSLEKKSLALNIEAPNVVALKIEGFVLWDRILFESCCTRLEEVYIDLSNHNVAFVYEGINKLFSCVKLTLKTTNPLHSILTCGIQHPFAKNIKTGCKAAIEAMVQLKSLTLIDDEVINGQALLLFIEYKAQIGNPLEQLIVQGCNQVRGQALDALKEAKVEFGYSETSDEDPIIFRIMT